LIAAQCRWLREPTASVSSVRWHTDGARVGGYSVYRGAMSAFLNRIERAGSSLELFCVISRLHPKIPDFIEGLVMKWVATYLVGFVVLMGGLLAALWKLGILQNIGTTWTLIGVAILIGIGIMISVSHSGSKENIQIDRK
jgi:hypothetical protein